MNEAFRRFSNKTSEIVGSSWSFIVAVLVILVWFFTGPMFEYSDTWQLIINTGTTIVTFLMVFLIQNTQNRDAKAIHLKLDELLRAVEGARTGMVDLENFTDKELQQLQEQFQRLREQQCDPEDNILDQIEEELEERQEERGTVVQSANNSTGKAGR
jgi:low affinity Fe/Cu permease